MDIESKLKELVEATENLRTSIDELGAILLDAKRYREIRKVICIDKDESMDGIVFAMKTVHKKGTFPQQTIVHTRDLDFAIDTRIKKKGGDTEHPWTRD